MERVGDTNITTISQRELPKIFGLKNISLLNILSDHANSNEFFAEITIAYDLQRLVQYMKWKHRAKKEEYQSWGDIFEAWVGCYIFGRQLYDKTDPLDELSNFLLQDCWLRYRDLKTYI